MILNVTGNSLLLTNFILYSNPFKGQINVCLEPSKTALQRVQVYTVKGRLINNFETKTNQFQLELLVFIY